MIHISAILCTYNRANYLAKAIASLAAQTLPVADYEILVVDNGSTDSTKAVVTQQFRHLPNLRYCYEPQLGLSRARNAGYRAANGRFVAYLDDDAVADPGWLAAISHAFATADQPGCVGGPIRLIWEAPRPGWLPDSLLVGLGLLDLGSELFWLDETQWLFGGNMAFPRSLLAEAGGFAENLGRQGRKLLANEEIDLKQRLERAGHRYFYHPDIAIGHHVPAARLQQVWFRQRAYGQGLSEAVAWRAELGRLARGRKAGYALRQLLRPFTLTSLLFPTQNPARFGEKCRAVRHLGLAWGLLRGGA